LLPWWPLMHDVADAFESSSSLVAFSAERNDRNLFFSSTSEPVTCRDMYGEVRVLKDISLLLDEIRSSVVFTETLEGAVERLVQDFIGRGVLQTNQEDAVEALARLRLSNSDGTVVVSALEVPGLKARLVGLIITSIGDVRGYVITSTFESGTKNARELALNLASFLSILDVRCALGRCLTVAQVQDVVRPWLEMLVIRGVVVVPLHEVDRERYPLSGIINDVKRKAPYYWSDWRDAFIGPKHLQKTISATAFLFCTILGPSLALGQEYSQVTSGIISIQQVMWMQLVGGVAFALLGGQPLLVVMTTAPMTLFAKVLFGIASLLGVPFLPLYGWTGLFAAIFILLIGVFNLSWLVRYLSLFTEEIFGMFISASFVFSTCVALVRVFSKWYSCAGCVGTRDVALLYLLLVLATLWIGLAMRRIRNSPYLNERLREVLADFALPFAVMCASFFGSYVLGSVPLEPFEYSPTGRVFVSVSLSDLPGFAIAASVAFGIILALLAVIDHDISSAMAQNPSMKLCKGTAYHYDLVILSGVMVVSALFGMPFLTAAVPFSPDHVLALSDKHRTVLDGHTSYHVSYARETRVTAVAANAMVGVCILLLPYPLRYVPVSVLYGVFLFMAVTALDNNSFFERFSLLLVQASLYPSVKIVDTCFQCTNK
jgi:sodium borate transporter 11